MIAAGCVSSRAEEGVSPVSSVWVRKRPGSQPLQRRFSSLELSPPQHLHVASLLSTPDGEQLLTVLPLPRNGSEIDLHSNLSASARGERSPAADTATEEGPGARTDSPDLAWDLITASMAVSAARAAASSFVSPTMASPFCRSGAAVCTFATHSPASKEVRAFSDATTSNVVLRKYIVLWLELRISLTD